MGGGRLWNSTFKTAYKFLKRMEATADPSLESQIELPQTDNKLLRAKKPLAKIQELNMLHLEAPLQFWRLSILKRGKLTTPKLLGRPVHGDGPTLTYGIAG